MVCWGGVCCVDPFESLSGLLGGVNRPGLLRMYAETLVKVGARGLVAEGSCMRRGAGPAIVRKGCAIVKFAVIIGYARLRL